MIRYRVYTEDVNRNETLALASKSFQGFNVLTGLGCYKGQIENTIIFEVLSDKSIDTEVDLFAYRLKNENSQEVILVTREVVEGGMK